MSDGWVVQVNSLGNTRWALFYVLMGDKSAAERAVRVRLGAATNDLVEGIIQLPPGCFDELSGSKDEIVRIEPHWL